MSKHGSRMLLFILLVVITIHGLWSVSLATPDAEKKTLLPVRRPSTAAVDVVTDSSSTHVVVEDKVTDVISTITPEKPPSNEIVAPVASTTPENDRSALQQNQVATTTGGEAQKSPTNTRTAFPTLANLTAKSLHEIISTDTAAMEYPNICFYGSTNFYFRKHTTMTFVMGLLTLLRNVALQSYNSALIGRGEITVLTPIKSFYSETNQSSDLLPHFTSLQEIQDFMEPVVSTYGKVNVDFAADALERATRQFQQTNCSWVVSTKLDADDFLAPGYLDWIAQKVIPSLQNHHRGAVVGGRFIGNLQYGYGRCQVITDEGPHHWPGESMGQTRVFRRKVFEDLGMPFEAPEHTKTLHVMRKSVYERYIDVSNGTEKLPKGMRGKKLLRNFLFQQEMDADLENMTGIRMVETHHAGFGAPGVWLKTQLSSHMSYKQLKKAKTFCSEAEWSTIINEAMFMNGIKSKFEYVYDTLKALNTSFYDTCKSSRTFAMFQNDATESCEKIDKQLTRDMPQLSYQ